MGRTTPRISTRDVTAPAVTVVSQAKVNLILRILDRRPDGYHNLWSLMQTVGLADTLTIALDPDSTDVHVTCTHPDVPLGPANLVYRAAQAVFDRAGIRTGVRIVLEKHIPMGAGLGGGSSNAAATVVGLVRLLDLRWTAAEMADATHLLGSDVPFFFYAPTAVVTGRGETVRPLRVAGQRWLLLVNPGFGVETAWAYRTLAAGRTQAPPVPEGLRALGATGVEWRQIASLMGNDFEDVVFPHHPMLKTLKERLREAGAESAFLSGTGATVFGVFPSLEAAERARDGMVGQSAWKTWVVPTESEGMRAEVSSGPPAQPS